MRGGAGARLACGAVLLCLALAVTAGTAAAYLSAAASGSVSAAVGELGGPSLTAEGGSEAVGLSWSAIEAPGPGAVRYAVSRDGGAAGGDCPGDAAPGAATSCTDTGVPPGPHVYVVTARWGSWSAAGEAVEAEVEAGAAVKLVLEAEAAAVTAGAADRLTVVAEDEGGEAVASYDGIHELTFSGANPSPAGDAPTVTDGAGAAVELGAATPLEFEDGVATVSGAANGVLRLHRAETASITATDGSISTAGPLEITVEAAAPERLAFADARVSRGAIEPPCLFACAVSGLGRGRFEAAIAVTDAFGNVVPDLGGGHRVGITASDGRAFPGSLWISPWGPAESSWRLSFRFGRRGAPTATIVAESTSGVPYEFATALVGR